MATGDKICSFKAWEVAPGGCKPTKTGVNAIALSADGRKLATGGDATTILVWDVLSLLRY
jgi:WD40 repeat protein